MKYAFVLSSIISIIVPCVAQAAPQEQATHTKYACEDGKTLDIVYVGDYAVIKQMDELIPMRLSVSASGMRYLSISKDYSYELWGKQNDMNLSDNSNGKEQTILSGCKP
ncbi:lysozyme [Klebsiella pneumoniae]|uniref:MliC family protein n=1 Tax=Klebsiella pneumoniae TaxID=573 RepID=UPI001CA5E03D|nr:MliC family protein [Klebsiella pneumoniae]MBW6047752.1 lysozyme [Klebsiella pneumoniae]MBX4579149.1 lysozyme [Klebsiella pneumoniae]